LISQWLLARFNALLDALRERRRMDPDAGRT